MKKNITFERWVADGLTNGLIFMEPYGYREDGEGQYLHIFRITLQFDNVPEPFEGVAFVPIPFDAKQLPLPDFSFDEDDLDFSEDY